MTTVKKLIELLSDYKPDMIVTNELNEPFTHMVNTGAPGKVESLVLSTKKPIAYCNRTGGYVYPTTTPDYFGYSQELDEDVYSFETEPLNK